MLIILDFRLLSYGQLCYPTDNTERNACRALRSYILLYGEINKYEGFPKQEYDARYSSVQCFIYRSLCCLLFISSEYSVNGCR